MNRRALAAFLLVALTVGGLLLDRDRPAATAAIFGRPASAATPIAAPPADALSASWFCPGAPAAPGGSLTGTITVANFADRDRIGSITIFPSAGEPVSTPLTVPARKTISVRLGDMRHESLRRHPRRARARRRHRRAKRHRAARHRSRAVRDHGLVDLVRSRRKHNARRDVHAVRVQPVSRDSGRRSWVPHRPGPSRSPGAPGSRHTGPLPPGFRGERCRAAQCRRGCGGDRAFRADRDGPSPALRRHIGAQGHRERCAGDLARYGVVVPRR